jgi:hypothetical protein
MIKGRTRFRQRHEFELYEPDALDEQEQALRRLNGYCSRPAIDGLKLEPRLFGCQREASSTGAYLVARDGAVVRNPYHRDALASDE